MTGALFPALLRYWRGRRGLSQLDLAVRAGVSSRHVSFLESNRSRPSEEMVLLLLSMLGVPLRAQNEALLAAGYAPRFPSPTLDELPEEIDQAVAQMMAQHEPYPMALLTLEGEVVRSNEGARHLFAAFVAEPAELPARIDLFDMLFDPRLMRPFVVGWESVARSILSRLNREDLQRGDARLGKVLDRLSTFEGTSPEWRHPDFATPAPPTLRLELARGDLRVRFLVAVTVFSSPQQVALDELRIESCFALDEATRAACALLARGAPRGA